MALTVADGQVAAATATIYTGTRSSETVNALFTNTSGATTETVVVTLTDESAVTPTARRIARAVLSPNEQLFIGGIPMASDDLLKAATTDATTVDYIISSSSSDLPFTILTLDANGSLKQTASTATASATTVTSASATALAVGLQGTTDPALQVDASTASSVTGIKIKSAAAAAGVAISVIGGNAAENLTLDAKGAGTVTINGTATGNVVVGANLAITNAKNVVLATTTGSSFGTATTQKLSFYGVTAVVQPAASTDATTGTTGAATGMSLDTTFKGNGGTAAYTVGGVVTALKALGLLAT